MGKKQSRIGTRSNSDVHYLNLGTGPSRPRITAAKIPFLKAILAILEAHREYWPVSQRFIHYRLLSDPPLRHASKPDSAYCNDGDSSASLSDLCTRGLEELVIPPAAIADETRPITVWDTHDDVDSFQAEQAAAFLTGYGRDLMQSQTKHFELVLEKNTLIPVLKSVASEFRITMTSAHGYCSMPPKYAMAERFKASGKQNLVLLLITDFDPDGEEICLSFARSMRDNFQLPVLALKPALTYEQTLGFDPAFGMDVKEKQSEQKTKFQAKYGDALAFEVDALAPTVLQEIVRNAVLSVIDVDAYQREKVQEQKDWLDLERRRTALLGPLNL